MLFYPAALPLSAQTLRYAAGAIRRHRSQIGSYWQRLSPSRQALLVLAYLRKGETFAELAAGFGIGTATAWRYVNECPPALLDILREHRKKQAAERLKAGSAWTDHDLVFATRYGSPIDRTEDWRSWKAILRQAGVRDARVHDARHTAATLS